MTQSAPHSSYQYVHGNLVYAPDKTCAIVANLKHVETGESILKVVPNPPRPFWITKKQYQTHSQKLEYAPMHELDMFTVPEPELNVAIANQLGIPHRGYISRKRVLDSPYVYGADIPPQVLMKQYFKRITERNPPGYNVGALDIEVDVVNGTNEIIAVTYIDGKTRVIYTAILKKFLKGNTLDDVRKVYHETKQKYYNDVKPEVQKLLDERPFKLDVHEFDIEINLITWIWQRIHQCKPDFISIWNMQFDIEYMISRIDFRGKDPATIMCHPDVPIKYRTAKLIKDQSKLVDHFTDRWDWFQLSGYSQCIDTMCLYSRLRKAKGRETRYDLDSISHKILGTGKMPSDYSTHYDRQRYEPVRYSVYNIFDSLNLVLMDDITNDISSLVNLCASSQLSEFSKQTVQIKNNYFEYCRANNMVPAACAGNQAQDIDKLITNVGGAVLDPNLARDTGVSILEEHDINTRLHKLVSDIDVTGHSGPCSREAA